MLQPLVKHHGPAPFQPLGTAVRSSLLAHHDHAPARKAGGIDAEQIIASFLLGVPGTRDNPVTSRAAGDFSSLITTVP